MSDLDLVPPPLARRSLSSREPVFTLGDAIEALAIYHEQAIGMWGWEAWALHSDGRHGHYPAGVIGLSIERQSGESWSEFVARSVDACRTTIVGSAREWGDDARARGVAMYFCLTPARPDD